MFFIYFLACAELSLGAKSISSSHFLSHLAHICSSTSSNVSYNTQDLWGILEKQANAHKNIHTRQFVVMWIFHGVVQKMAVCHPF